MRFKAGRLLLSPCLVKHICWSSFIKQKIEGRPFKKFEKPIIMLIFDTFLRHGHEIRVCGGAVRDTIKEISVKNIDFASLVSLEKAKDLLLKENFQIKHEIKSNNTLLFQKQGVKKYYYLQLSPNHIDNPSDKDWEEYARKQDFTINALYLDQYGNVYDYINGLEDLENGEVKFIGNPDEKLAESPESLLKYFRFVATFAADPNSHKKDVLNAIEKHLNSLECVNGATVWNTFKKIFTLGQFRNVPSVIKTMISLGVLQKLGFPEEPNINEFEEVWNRAHDLQPQPVVFLCALLKNMHELQSLRKKLYIDKDDYELAAMILEYRDCRADVNPLKPYQELFFHKCGKPLKIKKIVSELIKYHGRSDLLQSFWEWDVPKFPITLTHLVNHGVKSYSMAKKVEAKLKVIWLESDFSLSIEELLQHLPKVVDTLNK